MAGTLAGHERAGRVLLVLGAVLLSAGTPQEDQAVVRFPAAVVDIDGNSIRIDDLARSHNLVVVTLKAPWCPVCQQQLRRLVALLPKLRQCDVTFVVLSPGPAEELAAIRSRTGFEFPFVADTGLAIARSLGLAMNEDEIYPCMLQILPDRSIGWRQMGRNGAYFGDGELKRYFDCRPV